MGIPTEAERILELLESGNDAFDNRIGRRTNVLDMPAHYPISPERWTLKVDGSRVFPQYGSVPQYTHDSDRHLLQPASGETVTLRSAERPRYVVAFELATSFALAINQSLSAGDSIRAGLYDGSDGYYLEHTGSHDPKRADFVMERNGSEVYRKTDRALDKALTEFTRLRIQTGWYNVTRQQWEQSYADPVTRQNDVDESVQFNTQIATGDMGSERGPITGNLPGFFEVTADSATTNLELQVGSLAQVNLGDTTPFSRVKKIFTTDSVTTTGAWEPVRAFRVDPEREIINVQLAQFIVGKYSASADVEALLMAADPSKVLDGAGDPLTDADYSYPPEVSEKNNVLQQSTAVAQFPDSTGTPQTSMADPGGWQVGRSELLDSVGNDIASSAPLGVSEKRNIYSRDVIVVLLKSDTVGDARYQLEVEQDW